MITSFFFFILLVITTIGFWLLPNKYNFKKIILIFSSLIFIFFFDKSSFIVTIILSLYSFIFGELILKLKSKSFYHLISVVGLILCLIFFKYIGLLSTTLNSLNEFLNIFPKFEIRKILLPLGISYITLKHISYLTDIKWGIIKNTNFLDFITYTTLFTIFTAGPIERFERFKEQINNTNEKFNSEYFNEGFKRIVFGLFKKFALADWIAYFINPILSNKADYSFELRVLSLFGFSLLIYFDFSGYSDIAIGSSRLFGLKIMENFDYPYLKRNISQFWRGWHISLSDWIRDYIFMPLAKLSTNKIWIIFFVPIISMAICGIWHGAKLGFLLWGIWHGIGIGIYQTLVYLERKNKTVKKISSKIFIKPVSVILTFIFVTIGWIWFI